MSDISDFLVAYAGIDDPEVQADVDHIGTQLSPAALRGGADRAIGLLIGPPKPGGGGGTPPWVRARIAIQRALQHAHLMTVGIPAPDAKGTFTVALEAIVSDWVKSDDIAPTDTDARGMFVGGITPTDLVFLASEMNSMARFVPSSNTLKDALLTLRNQLANEAKNRLAPVSSTPPG
ncbi:MAG TPA: hypothetical protein VJM11_09525 [Nevskiaceae bacterium]|nr:hypothetical protein [Nevskiaceae bacterium]